MTPEDRLHDLEFNVQRSIRYHIARRRFFEQMDNMVLLIGIVFGSSGVISLISEIDPTIPTAMVAIIAISHALSLVFGYRNKGKLHHDLANEFMRLEKQMVVQQEATEHVSRWKAEVLEIETRELPRKKVLNILMHNEICLATDRKEYIYKIGWFRRLLAHVVDINPDGIELENRQTHASIPRTPGAAATLQPIG